MQYKRSINTPAYGHPSSEGNENRLIASLQIHLIFLALQTLMNTL